MVRALRDRLAGRATFLIGACEPLSVPVPLRERPARGRKPRAGRSRSGASGTGKTALVREFERRLAASVPVWRSHCEPLSVPIPLAPIRSWHGRPGRPRRTGAIA